jgi:hypothetical protein
VQLIAQRSFSYANRSIRKGEEFAAPDDHARLLMYAGSAKAAKVIEQALEAEEADAAPRPRRRYRRRDMQADTE